MMRRGRETAVFGAVALCAAAANAGYLDVTVQVHDAAIRVEYRDRQLLAPVEGRHGVPLFSYPGEGSWARTNDQPVCGVDWRVEPVPGGFDLPFTLRNPTNAPARRPDVTIAGFRLKSDVETVRDTNGTVQAYVDRGFHWLDSRTLGTVRTECRHWSPWRMQYPNDLYAPVLAAWDDEVAVGVSLLYDPWAAQHDVYGQHVMTGPALHMGFRLHAPDSGRATPGKALLPPGEEASYRVCVRFAQPDPARAPHPGWLDSLEPYRRFFAATYGGVTYERDLRPVMGQPVAQMEFQDAERNPRGYHTGFDGTRVDLDGWGPFAAWLGARVDEGYRRVMVWAPSGLYLKGANYPPEFMTGLPPRLVETWPELLGLKERGVSLGIWWGRSSQVSGGWNSGRMWPRDVNRAEDREAAFREVDLAAARGVDEVGLDAWGCIALWERYGWLKTLKEKYPALRFITESSECDIMHTLAPTYDVYRRQSQRPVLADWLVPGHESWIHLGYREVNQENFDRVTSWKCVPVTLSRAVPHDAASFYVAP